jgi:hypothetical protein
MSDKHTMLKKLLHRAVELSMIIAGSLMFSVISDAAYAESAPSAIFQNVSIGRNFNPDPLVVNGVSGGFMDAKKIAGTPGTVTGPCTGYIDENPNHTIELTNKFDYLKLTVDSIEDTTLVIVGPGGAWCNDEFNGSKNPGIIGEWLPGNYKIWVGSYQKSKYLPYTLKITTK